MSDRKEKPECCRNFDVEKHKDPDGGTEPASDELNKQKELNSEYSFKPKINNVMRYFAARENGTVTSHSANYFKMRCLSKEVIRSMEATALSSKFGNLRLDYLLGSSGKFYTSWFAPQYPDSRNVLISFNYRKKCSCSRKCYDQYYDVIDLCKGLLACDIVVLQKYSVDHTKSHRASLRDSAYIINNGGLVDGVNKRGRWRILSDEKKLHRPMFCCSSNKKHLLYAFGCDNAIGLWHVNNTSSIINVDGGVHTISFSPFGNIMASGATNGMLFLHDLRSQQLVSRHKISENCLTDSVFLNCQNIIIGGADNVLCNLDRRRGIVRTYLNHKKDDFRKSPLSFTDNMLCARGSDNCVRIYDLQAGGLPLQEIRNQQDADLNIQGWLYLTDGKDPKPRFQLFEDMKKTTFSLG